MKKRKNKPKTFIEQVQSIRGSWGAINPVTRVVPDKKKYNRKKVKKVVDIDN